MSGLFIVKKFGGKLKYHLQSYLTPTYLVVGKTPRDAPLVDGNWILVACSTRANSWLLSLSLS